MIDKSGKLLKVCIPFESKVIKQEEGEEEFLVTGLASTNDEDRDGDIVVSEAWKSKNALANYLKNPVILAFHDHKQPIGKTVNHEVTENGLKITAKISKTADKIITLIKEGILGAFSVGFMIKDADFDPQSGVFAIKDLELFEISVVSVPANQNALFSIAKNFSSDEEYYEYKTQFIDKSISKETLMIDKENKDKDTLDLADLAKQVASLVKGDLKKEEAEARQKAEKDEADKKRIEVTATSAAEKLVADLKKELIEGEGSIGETLKALKQAILENKDDLEKEFNKDTKNKMQFKEDGKDAFTKLKNTDKDGLLYASWVKGVPITELKAFENMVGKSGMEHWDAGVVGEWETSYSTRIMDAMKEDLVLEALFQSIPMTTPTMYMPINPEAGDATWVHDSALRSSGNPSAETGDGTDTSTGEAKNHQLDEQLLVARKLATREYIGYEEEEDSIVALAPVINAAIARRMARTSDLALLRGAGVLTNTTSYDPITGLENRGGSTTDVDVAGGASWATNFTEDAVVNMRRNLGIYGLDPGRLVFVCSHDLYYELMKLDNFKTVDVLGDRATIITGQVGSLFGIKVIVSQQFDNAAITAGTVGTTLGVLCRPENFLIGNFRSLMTETDKDVINQKRVIVSSRRFAFQDIISGQGTVNLSIATAA